MNGLLVDGGPDFLYEFEREEDLIRPKCVVFSDIRGDLRLFVSLLSQVTKVAALDENNEWKWNVRDTTLVCLGNFTNRYERIGYNRLMIPTGVAINEQIRILRSFRQLEENARMQPELHNHVVVLMGNHELANVLNWSDYEMYQMAEPDNKRDQKEFYEFVESELKPFCYDHGLIAGWGLYGATIYFSRGGLEKDWFETNRIKSIQDLNKQWKNWWQTNNYIRFRCLSQSNSPILSTKMSLTPSIWRQNDRDEIVQKLGDDSYPKFVQTVIPIQKITELTWDLLLRAPFCEHPVVQPHDRLSQKQLNLSHQTMLASVDARGNDEIYFIHNCMADTFCSFPPEDRQPQALGFEIIRDASEKALYMKCKMMRMSDAEYATYLVETRRTRYCPPPLHWLTPQEIVFTDAEQFEIRQDVVETVTYADNDNLSEIRYAGIILFGHHMKSVLLLNHSHELKGESTEYWDIPIAKHLDTDNNIWKTVEKTLQQQTGFGISDPYWKGITVDYRQHTRLWIRRVHSNDDMSINNQLANWIDYEKLWSQKLSYVSQLCFCLLMKAKMIPEVRGYEKRCPMWVTAEDRDPMMKRIRPRGWWHEKD